MPTDPCWRDRIGNDDPADPVEREHGKGNQILGSSFYAENLLYLICYLGGAKQSL